MKQKKYEVSVGFTATLKRVWWWAVVVGFYASFRLCVATATLEHLTDLPTVVDAALTAALGVLMVFRVNRAYERWWEARTLWGDLVNISRNLAVKVRELIRADRAECREVQQLIVAYSYSLKDHLRQGTTLSSLRGFEGVEEDPRHVPSFFVRQLYRRFHHWQHDEKISHEQLWVLDQEARCFLEVCGGCERIKGTLMSLSFPTLVRQCLVLYFVYLPWSLDPNLGWVLVGVCVIVAYLMIAAEGIAYYVERPFGEEDDHLDLQSICEKIDASVSEILLSDPKG